jgi:hypothetical protein
METLTASPSTKAKQMAKKGKGHREHKHKGVAKKSTGTKKAKKAKRAKHSAGRRVSLYLKTSRK